MKICYIVNARIPSSKAHGIQIMKMCEAFALEGHEVVLVAPNRRTSIKDDPFSYYGVRSNFKIKKLWTLDTVRFGKIGFRFHHLLFSLVSACYAASGKFDIIYSRDDLPLFLLTLSSKKLALESHMGRYNFLTALLLRSGAKLTTISNRLKEFYVSKGVPKSQILVAHDAVDLMEFNTNITKEGARRQLNLPLDVKIVMYIGALKEWKGYLTLLESSKYLSDDIQVVIIGNMGKRLVSLPKTYPQAIFLGIQPYRNLPVNQKAADVLVIPNTTTNDPFELFTSPLKVFAHMASGVPIIASDVPPLREVLSDKNSFIF
ncbi:MAG: Glycosyl transferase group 1, partial [Candidatus Daviesbacteria bacterium GW2011_GWB1_41_5]